MLGLLVEVLEGLVLLVGDVVGVGVDVGDVVLDGYGTLGVLDTIGDVLELEV